MAINKNFVIKNGVQVSTDLIIGDADNNKVGIGTTIPGYDLHVAIGRKSRGGIGATDLVVTGVSTVKDLLVGGFSGFSSDISVTGIVSARSFGIGTTEIIDRGMRLSGIASLDAITIATIEEAIRVGPNSFTDLKVTGISTFIGIATFSTGIDIKSGVSTFSAPLRLGFAHTTDHAGVALGATVGFGTSAFFRDDAAIFMGSDSDLKIHHDGSNSRIQDVGTGDLIIQGSADIKLQSASAENYIVANDTGSVDVYFDNSKKLETTSGGLKVTGITTLTDRLHVEAGISTFDADVRFGIGATVGFGTSAFFRDDAAIFLGNSQDIKIHHDGTDSFITNNTGELQIANSVNGDAIFLQAKQGENSIKALANGAVEQYFDNSKKTETTSGGFKVTGITTFTDRINVVSGVSTFQDDAKLTFGAQTDLLIQHDGTDTEIYNKTGNLKIRANDLDIQDYANGHSMITADRDGSVDLFYDNYNALQTTPQGINVSGVTTSNRLNVTGIATVGGALSMADNVKAQFGTGGDLQVFFDGTHSKVDHTPGSGSLFLSGDSVLLTNSGQSEYYLSATENGAVNLFYDAGNVFQTTPQGINVSGVTTSNRLLISGISTFTGLIDANGGAHIDNLRLGIDADNDITTSSGNLTLDSTGGTVEINDNLTVDGLLDANAGAHIDNLRLGIDADNDITTSSGNLTLDSTGGTVEVNDNLQVDGQTDLNGDINLGDATSETITVTARFDSDLIPSTDGARDLGSSSLEFKDLHLDGTAHIDTLDVDESAFVTTQLSVGTGATIFANGNIAIAGVATVGNNIELFGTGPRITFNDENENPDFYIEANATQFLIQDATSDAQRFRIQSSGTVDIPGNTNFSNGIDVSGVGNFDDTTQSTSATTGAVIIDGGLGVAKNVNIGGNLTVTGTTTFNGGTITLGDANTDNVVFTADVDSNIIPDDDDTYDLGSSTKEWNDLFIDGTAHIDTLDVDESAFVTTTLTVGTGVTVYANGNVAAAGIATVGGALLVGAGVTVGGDILPDADGSRDLGSATLEFQDLFIDGTANIDSLAADTAAIGDLTDNRVVIAGTSGELEDDANLTFDGSKLNVGSGVATVFVTTGNVAFAGIATVGGALLVGAGVTVGGDILPDADGSRDLGSSTLEFQDLHLDGTANIDTLDVDGTSNFADDVTLVAAGSSTILFDASAHDLIFQDNIRAKFGTGSDLDIHHNGTDSVITNATGDLNIITTGDDINITAADDINLLVQGGENGIAIKGDGEVILYRDAAARVTTTSDGTDFGGTGSIRVPNGTTGERNSSPAAGDFRYNTTTGKFEGYTDEWGDIGGSGGVDETDTSVSTTSATSCGSFAIASFRSASIIAQITQGSNYQVGRYLVIHDGTNVTTIEESAVATGSMLGTFEGVINSSNLEFRVTMGSSSSATVTTKIDTVTV